MNTPIASFAQRLKDLHACQDAVEWVGDRDLSMAWAECERADWMLWLAEHVGVDRRITALVGCGIARTVLHLVRAEDRDVCERAIAAREAWCRGEETEEPWRAWVAAWAVRAEAATGAWAWAEAAAAAGAGKERAAIVRKHITAQMIQEAWK